jgi:hypothetical protein
MVLAQNGIEATQIAGTLDCFTSSTAVEHPEFVGDREERSIWLQDKKDDENDKFDDEEEKDSDEDFEDEDFDEEFEEDPDDEDEEDDFDDDDDDDDDDFVEDDDF